jgi:hypothetical protein
MSTGIYSIGVSGIAAAQLNLLATEHNVVNASTPGIPGSARFRRPILRLILAQGQLVRVCMCRPLNACTIAI